MFKFFDRFNKKENINKIVQPVDTLITNSKRFDITEAYNELRTNITFSISKKECKVICMTSAVASEGKSTTSVNNSITFAKSGKRILLIDCDLRKPNVAKLLNIENERGISDVLVAETSVDKIINKNVCDNLDVITSGPIPPNPVELLSSEEMINTIDMLKKQYDYIFIDAPPINVVTDAAIISKVTDGIVIVVRQCIAEKKLLMEAVRKLEFVGAKIIGFVLNDVGSSKTGYGSYKYSAYKYGRYKYNDAAK